ncbi:G-protein alpha subunit-domain-containing protein [Aspergillus heterothallicus]
MVDPISIIGTAGALANIIQLATQTITAIRELQSQWKDSDLTFLSLTGQLSSLRLALTKIEEWIALEVGAHYQLVMDLDDSIKCCNILLKKLQELVSSLYKKQNSALNFQSKIKLVFGMKNIDDVQKLLEHQTNALNLLLTACNCKTGAEQKNLLERSSSQKVLRQTRLDSASLMAQYDTSSIASQPTENSSKLSLAFSFDRTLFTSNVYERFFRGLTRRHLDGSQTHASPVQNEAVEADKTDHCYHTLLFIGTEYSGIETFLNRIADTFKNFPIDIHLRLQQMAAYRFVILSMKAILAALDIATVKFQSDTNMDHAHFLLGYVDDITLTKHHDERVGGAIRSLWHDSCMEVVRQSPQDFGITDSTVGFLDEHERIFSHAYKPTSKDMQTLEHRTLAAIEVHVVSKLNQESTEGGQKNAVMTGFQIRDVTLRFRSTTTFSFEPSAAIFLPVDLAGYHKVLETKPQQTALLHCISELQKTIQSCRFPQSMKSVIVLTVPEDLETQLAAHPFADYYPGYIGANEPDAVVAAMLRDLHNLRRVLFNSTVVKAREPRDKAYHLGYLIEILHFFAWLKSDFEANRTDGGASVDRNTEVIAYPAPCKLKSTPEIEVPEHIVKRVERKLPREGENRAWYEGSRGWYQGN